jgi:DNA-binding transcriptional ArsR family regulator
MEPAQALAALSALAHPDRLALVRLLVPSGSDGRAAGDIARTLGLSASRLSFHLAQLEGAGLLVSRPEGRRVIYAIDPQGLGRTIAFLLNDCCLDHPEVVACCRGCRDPAEARASHTAGGHSTAGIAKTWPG